MKILIVDTYYPTFLKRFNDDLLESKLKNSSFAEHKHALLAKNFGTSDFYSRHLNLMGVETIDIIANDFLLQNKWENEFLNKNNYPKLLIPNKFFHLPFCGDFLKRHDYLRYIALAQIKKHKPDIVYCQDLWFFASKQLQEIKLCTKLLVGQIASPLPSDVILKHFDLILTSFPHFVPKIRNKGVSCEYFRIGFETSMFKDLPFKDRDIPISFIGGVTRHHKKSLELLEFISNKIPIKIYGYGANRLHNRSAIRKNHFGEVYGNEMYDVLRRSKITFNRHIDVAEMNANNMRMFEATGMGSLLITDQKENLKDLFNENIEVISYNQKEDALEKIQYFLKNTQKASEIAKRGRQKTHNIHSYSNRMGELVQILDNYLKA